MHKFSLMLGALMTISLMLPQMSIAQEKLPRVTVEDSRDQLSVEDIWKSPSLNGPVISPNGKYMAATLASRTGRMNVVVVDLETRKGDILTGYSEFDVLGPRWVGNDRIVYSLGLFNTPTGPGAADGGGLFVVGRDGKERKTISGTLREAQNRGDRVYRSLRFVRTIPGTDEEVIASGNITTADSTDLYRLNLKTGKSELMTRGRPVDRTGDWIVDNNLVPRITSTNLKDTLTTVYYYRKDAQSEWFEIGRNEPNKSPNFVPLAIDADNQTLQVAYNGGRDTMAIYRFDPTTKKVGELIAQHPRYDMGATAFGDRVSGVIVDPETQKIVGYSVDAGKPETVWLDEKYSRVQRALDATLPNRVNSFRRTPDGKKMLVTSYSDTIPAKWYFYDDEKKSIEEIGTARPWLVGKLVEQVPFIYKTRDGLEIDGYYFLPKNYVKGTKLPTIVHVHGGPHARADFWGQPSFGVNEGQLFASKGYAVIVPNFRITPGLGSKIFNSGFGAVGRQMSDDHEDALQWGVNQGFVDPGRACISGASYGGYAALQALVRSSDKWRCAVSGLAVTDFQYQLTTGDGDTRSSTAGQNLWMAILGVKDLSEPVVRDISPVNHASKIKKPVFLYAGEEDIRVPIAQINRMAKELANAGNPPKEYVVKAKEAHGFGVLENSVDTWTKILAFLDENLKK
jgi:dipeptidyl aminopeptidase/acylaminoacyl peptidase